MAMEDSNSMNFWIFSLDDPELYHFYTAQAGNTSLYYALCVDECLQDFSPLTKEVMHLRNNCLLLVDHYLVPVFCQMPLTGYLIALTETFCELDEVKALLKLIFFHNTPEGVIDLGLISEEQRKCINLLYDEFHNAHDDLQVAVLRNLVLNLLLLSPARNLNKPLKSGHLLSYALQFMSLLNQYAFQEKKKDFYAEKIGITEKTLTHALKVIYNRTFREILIYKTLIEAMQILVFTDKNVAQIAHELNYDASGFSKLLLKWKKMYPKDLRIEYRKLANHVENNY